MTSSGSGIAHRRGTKETPHHVLALLGAPKVAAQVTHHLHPSAGPLAACPERATPPGAAALAGGRGVTPNGEFRLM